MRFEKKEYVALCRLRVQVVLLLLSETCPWTSDQFWD